MNLSFRSGSVCYSFFFSNTNQCDFIEWILLAMFKWNVVYFMITALNSHCSSIITIVCSTTSVDTEETENCVCVCECLCTGRFKNAERQVCVRYMGFTDSVFALVYFTWICISWCNDTSLTTVNDHTHLLTHTQTEFKVFGPGLSSLFFSCCRFCILSLCLLGLYVLLYFLHASLFNIHFIFLPCLFAL